MEIQFRCLFYYISFADVVVITKLQAGSMRIGAGKMTKAAQIQG